MSPGAPAPRAGAPAARGWLRAAPFLLVALVVAAYAPTFDAEFVVWDDDDHIYENRHIVAEDGYWDAWRDWRDPAFYPVTFTSWWVEWRVTDGDPWLFHVDNVLLHAANALLLGLLLQALGVRYGLAWAIAGVWALHPQEVASVAWLTERKNLLYALFYLASLLVYARSVGPGGTASHRAWALALLLALASLASKATAVTLPVAILLAHWVRGGAFDRRAAGHVGAFFALAIAVGLLHVSREQVTPLLPFATRFFVAARAAWFYVGKFLWPADLVAVPPRWPLEGAAAWGAASLAAVVAAAVVGLWNARRIPPVAWFGVALYAANVALVVGVVWFPFMGYSFVSDHLVYVPSIGLALVFGLAADALVRAVRVPGALRSALVGALWILLAALSWRQTGHWEDTERLWTETLEVHPESRLAHKNLGVYLREQGRPEEARRHFEATLALEPDDAEALLNLGVLASDRGDFDEALRYFGRTLELGAYSSLVLNNLGIAATRLGRPEEAIDYYERALELDPADARAWQNLGAARVAAGDVEGGIADYEAALRLDPRSLEAHYNLADALWTVGRPEDALRHYARAHEIDPTDPDVSYNWGVALMQTGRGEEAAERFRAVLAADPSHAAAAHNLGASLLGLGRLDEAGEALERARSLAPGDPDTARALAFLRQRRGDLAGAVDVLEEALASLAEGEEAPALASQLAWIRATAPGPALRDPQAAVALAERAARAGAGDPASLDVLAAAYASAGRFDDAEEAARRARDATDPGTPLAAERERRRALYAEARPFSPATPPTSPRTSASPSP